MHLPPLIYDLAVILAVAGIMSFLFQWIKQPVVLGYIAAGVIVGPYTPPFVLVGDIEGIRTWAELGVVFLMFTLGLEFSFRKLISVGVTASITAALEVGFFLISGHYLGVLFGWSSMDGLFLGAMLAISSTTIIIKALEELKLKNHRFARLIFGVLIVEDLFAILLLVALTTIATTKVFSPMALASATLNLFFVVGSWFVTGYFLVPKLITLVAKKKNNEMLTLISIGLCLLLVVLANHLGYSPALGAFIMGSILAETKLIHQIENLMIPLRDLFGAIFFVSIGMLIDPQALWEHRIVIGILCTVTIIGKIFITASGALVSGQSFRNSLQVGFGLAQIGEFSFIIATLGKTLNATSEKLYPIGVAVSMVTTFATPYLIKYSGPVSIWAEYHLPIKVKRQLGRYTSWWDYRRAASKKSGGHLLAPFKWFDRKFISKHNEEKRRQQQISRLAPWDHHVVTLIVHPNAVLVNQTLKEASLRSRFGINVVAIQRGVHSIVAPRPDEVILPADILSILGTDDRIDAFRAEVEIPVSLSHHLPEKTNYRLKHFRIPDSSFMAGQTIRQIGIGEKYQIMVVGVERSHKRIINPDIEFQIAAEDVVWVVGEQVKLDSLLKDMGPV